MKTAFAFVALAFFSYAAFTQNLPNLNKKPAPRYQETADWCPKEGSPNSDTELNLAKNRIGAAKKYYAVGFDVIKNLHNADFLAEHDRDELIPPKYSVEDKKQIKMYEGTPIRLQGYFKLMKDGSKSVGGVREKAEKCNCDETQFEHVDYHLWLVQNPDDTLRDAVVVEMTPRVRPTHVRWKNQDTLESDLLFLASQNIPVRVYGWMMFDGEHSEQLYKPGKDPKKIRRATLWEIHPIMKVETFQGGKWKVW
jgi:hypothetical protein